MEWWDWGAAGAGGGRGDISQKGICVCHDRLGRGHSAQTVLPQIDMDRETNRSADNPKYGEREIHTPFQASNFVDPLSHRNSLHEGHKIITLTSKISIFDDRNEFKNYYFYSRSIVSPGKSSINHLKQNEVVWQ